MRDGTGACAVRLLHWQFAAGQPQSGHTRPFPVEYTVREVIALLSEHR